MAVESGVEPVKAQGVKKVRLDWMDVAKGFAMLAIVVHHFFLESATLITGMFDVPLFLFVSGYFISAKKEDMRAFAKKKCKQLVVPYLWTCFAIVLGSVVLNLVWGSGLSVVVEDALYWSAASLCGMGESYDFLPMPSIGAIWFLLALFWGSLIMERFVIGNPFAPLVVLGCVCFACASVSYAALPWSIQAGMLSVLFLYAGWLAKDQGFFEGDQPWWFAIACFGVAAWAFCAGVRISVVSLSVSPLSVLAAFASLYLALLFCRKILCRISLVKRYLMFIGQNTLVVLGAHLFDMNLLSWSFLTGAISNGFIEFIVVLCAKFALYSAVVLLVNLFKDRVISLAER